MKSAILLVPLLCLSTMKAAKANPEPPRTKRVRSTLEARQLPKGVSVAEAQKLIAASQTATATANRELWQRRARLLEAMEKGLSQERAALQKALDADPEYETYCAKRDAILKGQIGNSARSGRRTASRTADADSDAVVKALQALDKSYASLFQRVWKNAGIKEADTRSKAAKILDSYHSGSATFSGFAAASGTEPAENPASDSGGGGDEIQMNFDPPYAHTSGEFTDVDSPNEALTQPDAGSGNLLTRSWMEVAGSCYALAGVGQIIEVPAGVRKVRVEAKIKASYSLWSLSMPAVSGTWSDALIDVTGPEGMHNRTVQNLGWVVAPLLLNWSASGEPEVELTSEFDVRPGPAGARYDIQISVSSNSYALGLGRASSTTRAQPVKNIHVTLMK